MEVKNAKIDYTRLGEIHNIFGFDIGFDYGGAGQSMGGWTLDAPLTDDKGKFIKRVAHAENLQKIMDLLDVLKVETWETLKGTPVRVKCDHSHIYAVGHFLKDEWVQFSKEDSHA